MKKVVSFLELFFLSSSNRSAMIMIPVLLHTGGCRSWMLQTRSAGRPTSVLGWTAACSGGAWNNTRCQTW